MLDPLFRNKFLGQFGKPGRNPVQGNYLHAVLLIEGKALHRQDLLAVLQLNISKVIGNISPVMVLNQGNRSCHPVVALPFLFHNMPVYQLAEGLGTVGKFVLQYIFIQGIQYALLKTHPETYDRHRVTILYNGVIIGNIGIFSIPRKIQWTYASFNLCYDSII